MATSFFTGTEAELYAGTEVFSAAINLAPTSYGLTAPEATSYNTLSDDYRSAYLTAITPATRTKGAVAAKNTAKALLRAAASDLALKIEGTASVTDQQKIDLGLNVRKVPAPVPPPGTPYSFNVVLGAAGGLTAGWKCNNPVGGYGVFYNVFRRNDPSSPYEFVGTAGQRKFIDDTIPAGASQITYKVQAARTTGPGPVAEFNVNFGISNSGSMTASVTPVRLAA